MNGDDTPMSIQLGQVKHLTSQVGHILASLIKISDAAGQALQSKDVQERAHIMASVAASVTPIMMQSCKAALATLQDVIDANENQ